MQDEVLILGGGVAGCAASIALARKGRSVTLIERELATRHKVCGEFLSGEALQDLHALGIDVASLGATPIDRVRLASSGRAAEAPLPFPAASLTRRALDTALLAKAIAAGVCVERGLSVQSLSRTKAGVWQAALDDGTTREAPAVFFATGKHDLRGHTRPKDPQQWVAYKMYLRLKPSQAAELSNTSELMLYPGGYGGIQPVEGGIANLCCVVQRRHLARKGHSWESFLARIQRDCPHLAMRLAGAEPLLARPIAISHIPYGYIRRTTEDGLYCIGDQAAVIPSFTGGRNIHRTPYCAMCLGRLPCGRAGTDLSGQAALRALAPDAPRRARCRWLEQAPSPALSSRSASGSGPASCALQQDLPASPSPPPSLFTRVPVSIRLRDPQKLDQTGRRGSSGVGLN